MEINEGDEDAAGREEVRPAVRCEVIQADDDRCRPHISNTDIITYLYL